MPKLGADVDQLDRLAASLDRAAARLEDNASVIERQVGSLWWTGASADRFAASWASLDRRHLSAVAARLRDVAQGVRLNAQQQRNASSRSFAMRGPDGWPTGSYAAGTTSEQVRLGDSRDVLHMFRDALSLLGGVDLAVGLLPLFGLQLPRLFGRALGGSKELRRVAHYLNAQITGNSRKLAGIGRQLDDFLLSPVKLSSRHLGGSLLALGAGAAETLITAREFGWEDGRTMKSGFEAVYVSGASLVAGPIGGVVAEGTIMATDAVAPHLDEFFEMSENTVEGHINRTYPSGMSATQAVELSERYEGIDGFGRFLFDGALAAPSSVSTGVSKGWHFVTPW